MAYTSPKSMVEGEKVIESTVKRHSMLKRTGITWLAPTTLIGMLNRWSSELRNLRQEVRIVRSGLNFAHISKEDKP